MIPEWDLEGDNKTDRESETGAETESEIGSDLLCYWCMCGSGGDYMEPVSLGDSESDVLPSLCEELI